MILPPSLVDRHNETSLHHCWYGFQLDYRIENLHVCVCVRACVCVCVCACVHMVCACVCVCTCVEIANTFGTITCTVSGPGEAILSTISYTCIRLLDYDYKHKQLRCLKQPHPRGFARFTSYRSIPCPVVSCVWLMRFPLSRSHLPRLALIYIFCRWWLETEVAHHGYMYLYSSDVSECPSTYHLLSFNVTCLCSQTICPK